MRTMIRTAAAVTACATLASAAAVAQAQTVPTNARECLEQKLVWVQVEYGQDNPAKGACAPKFSNGLEALQSAGFNVAYDGPGQYGVFITGIDGVNANWDKDGTYWSYWDGTVNLTTGDVAYSYYQVGASTSEPEPGSVESWVMNAGNAKPSFTKLPEKPNVPSPTNSDSSSQTEGGLSQGAKIALGVVAGIVALIAAALGAVSAGLISIPGLTL